MKKVYQVYHNHVVLHTTDTRELAAFLRDWCAAIWEHMYRVAHWPYTNYLDKIRKQADDVFFVMEVEVLSEVQP